jgi:uncharacterized protein (TIGR03118 family)
MIRLFSSTRASRGPRTARPLHSRPAIEMLEDRRLLAGGYLQTNLVSDVPGLAATTDPNLINPWGLAASSGSPFWVSDRGAGTSTLYDGQGNIIPLVVTIPPATPGALGQPSGIVFNTDSTGFNVTANVNGTPVTAPSIFLFATEDGVIAGWNPNVNHTQAIMGASVSGADFTGLAIGNIASQTFIYAADNTAGTIDVFDSNFNPVTNLAGSFTDPNLPAGSTAFNVQNIDGLLYVTYGSYTSASAGNGFVDIYNTEGQLLKRLISQGHLANPWGMTLAPSNFGNYSNDLLVGNFGDGHINVYDPTSGAFISQLFTSTGAAFFESNLWALRFGNGSGSGNTNTLYFTAGINDQNDGLFGSLQALPPLSTNAFLLPNLARGAQQVFSTIPPNGDLNPYGVAFVPQNIKKGGALQPGDILVSNFNDSTNAQGTGTTIVRISPNGQHSVFFQGQTGLGLTTALGVLQNGFVIVGNVPAPGGTPEVGSLLVLDSNGNLVFQFGNAAFLKGPWDMAINDQGFQAQLFVSNVLSGTVTRVNLKTPFNGTPSLVSETQIGSRYLFRTDPNALVVGPTGLAFDAAHDTLYVASTGNNAIYAIPDARFAAQDFGRGRLIVQNDPHMHGPLGLALAPNGDLILANGDAVNPDPNNLNELAEFTTAGVFVSQFQLDSGPGGGAFGLAISSSNGLLRFAAVDDNTNTLHVWSFLETPPPPATAHHDIDALFMLFADSSQDGHHHRLGDLF